MKYIVLAGGAFSALKKAYFTASLAASFSDMGIPATALRVLSHLSQNGKQYSCKESGEIFILDDGFTVCQALGVYERVLDKTFTKQNYITLGSALNTVLNQENNPTENGVVSRHSPTVSEELKKQIISAASKPLSGTQQPQVCLIDLSCDFGTFEGSLLLDGIKALAQDPQEENTVFALFDTVSKTPGDGLLGDSVAQLARNGVCPDALFVSSELEHSPTLLRELHSLTEVGREHIHFIPPSLGIPEIPVFVSEHPEMELLLKKLSLSQRIPETNLISRWRRLYSGPKTKKIRIALVGKESKENNCYHSIETAIRHACIEHQLECELLVVSSSLLEQKTGPERTPAAEEWERLKKADGIVLSGGNTEIEGRILACQYARENKIPLLGICLGMQAMAIEYTRNVLGLPGAHSTEFSPETNHPVIDSIDKSRYGAKKETVCADCRIARRIFGGEREHTRRFAHGYILNNKYVPLLRAKGLAVCTTDCEEQIVTGIAIESHPFMVGTQSHPEFTSRIHRPSPEF
ncbi:MAG: CTP synthase, partial [Amphiamblys sp. WSBS2006]